MRKTLFIAILAGLFLFWPSTAHAAAGYCSIHAKAASANNNSVTTTGVDTTGCTAIVLYCSSGLVTQSASDSKSNSWSGLTASGTTDTKVRGFYSQNPTVGASHTFTCTATTGFPSICVIALNGTGISVFRSENGAEIAGVDTSLHTASISPESTDIAVTAVSLGGTHGTVSIDSSFTITDMQAYGAGVNYGVSCAYKTTPSGSENPLWSWDNAVTASATIDAFKQAGATVISSQQKYLLVTQ